MKTNILFLCLSILTGSYGYAQSNSPEDKAVAIAKNDFSSDIHTQTEKFGAVKEKHKVIESTPVSGKPLQFYTGNYVFNEIQYELEIRLDAKNNPMVTLTAPDQPVRHLKNVTISDAYFVGFMPNGDGSEEKWEGVFINKSHAGNTTFGLGIKVSTAIPIADSIQLNKLFFKKVTP